MWKILTRNFCDEVLKFICSTMERKKSTAASWRKLSQVVSPKKDVVVLKNGGMFLLIIRIALTKILSV